MQNLTKTLCGLLLLLLPAVVSAQGSDPIVGTWNITVSRVGQPTLVLSFMNFNAGGTLAEFDTSGTNSSASPGESIELGIWSNTGGQTYTFKDENVVYDSSGKLSSLVIGTGSLTLAPNMNTFSGTLTITTYSCSLARCPGPLQGGPSSFPINGTRF